MTRTVGWREERRLRAQGIDLTRSISGGKGGTASGQAKRRFIAAAEIELKRLRSGLEALSTELEEHPGLSRSIAARLRALLAAAGRGTRP